MAGAVSNLWERAKGGDRDAFWNLVTPHRGLIYSVALATLQSAERAEDLMHDVLLAAFRSIATLRDPERLAPWLYTMTRNLANDQLRKENRRRQLLHQAAREINRVVPPGEWMETERTLAGLEAAIERLPEPFRVILALKYMNDYPYRRIAEILELSEAAVKARLFEARKLLRKITEAAPREGDGSNVLNQSRGTNHEVS